MRIDSNSDTVQGHSALSEETILIITREEHQQLVRVLQKTVAALAMTTRITWDDQTTLATLLSTLKARS